LTKSSADAHTLYVRWIRLIGGDEDFVSEWGNSLAVRVPRIMAQETGAREGRCRDEERKRRKPRYTLNELLSTSRRRAATTKSTGARALATKPGEGKPDYCPDALVWIDLNPTLSHERLHALLGDG